MLPGIGVRSPRPPFKIIPPFRERWPYNGLVADSLKVPKDEFERVMKALLNTPPMPMADIPRKREPKRKPVRKKRG
jgi:hypothetical protein